LVPLVPLVLSIMDGWMEGGRRGVAWRGGGHDMREGYVRWAHVRRGPEWMESTDPDIAICTTCVFFT
jgi:hypothetical protein